MFVCPECGSAQHAPGYCTEHGLRLRNREDDLLLGEMVGSYRIARLIGRGGMGEVYLGVQPAIGSRVAIKILAPQCAHNPTLVERFFAEARAVNVIRHESIVNVLDLARLADGRPYIVMEFLDGAPLSELFAVRGPLPVGSAVEVVLSVLDVLDRVHARGITHRDLKPDNLFVTSGGALKVLDFGIAKLRPDLASPELATRTGALLGTPHYMSPEQARGRTVDHRSDLYSTGVILFEALTGRRPFDAPVLYDLLRLQIEGEPPRPSTLCSDIPPALEQVVLRAMHKDPSLRFQTAREFSAMLTAVAQSLPHASFVRLSNAAQRFPAHAQRSNHAPTHTPEIATAPAFARTHTETSGRSRLRWFGVTAALGIALATLTALTVVVARNKRETVASADARGSRAQPAPHRERARRTPPTKVDPAHLELDAHFDVALGLARTHFSDAELVGFAATPVRVDGTVDLSQRDAGVTWTFQSAAAPSKPLASGGPPMGRCAVVVSSVDGTLAANVPIVHVCGQKTVPLPLCSVRHVVERARLGASPRKISVAYLGFGKQPTWNVNVDGRKIMIPDDC